jgi:hypothetical protein
MRLSAAVLATAAGTQMLCLRLNASFTWVTPGQQGCFAICGACTDDPCHARLQPLSLLLLYYWHPAGKSSKLDAVDQGTLNISFTILFRDADVRPAPPQAALHTAWEEKKRKKSCFVFRDGMLPRVMVELEEF